MRRFSAVVGILGLAGIILLIAPYRATHAEEPQPVANFAHIQVVTYGSGLTGFFDTRDGTLYIYDGSLGRCVFIRRIAKLGDPLQNLRDFKPGG